MTLWKYPYPSSEVIDLKLPLHWKFQYFGGPKKKKTWIPACALKKKNNGQAALKFFLSWASLCLFYLFFFTKLADDLPGL